MLMPRACLLAAMRAETQIRRHGSQDARLQPRQSMHERLRHGTRHDHARMERRLDILNRLSDPRRRRAVMTRFWLLHRGVEPILSRLLGDVEGLDYEARRKSPLLAADVEALGGPLLEGASPVPPLQTSSPGEALGLLYVLEGSTLGGRIIRREMATRGETMVGLGYFDAYGALTGQRWRAFTAVLDREAERGDEGTRDAIARGADLGFRHVEAWLCGAQAE
jgi:heme oxygenase